MLVRRLDQNHDMMFGYGLQNFATEQEACMQNVKTRLYILRGEWFLDTDAGVPYLQSIMGIKPPDFPLTESIIKQRILQTTDVVALANFELLFDRNTREANVRSDIITIYGQQQVTL